MTKYYELKQDNTIGQWTQDKQIADEIGLALTTEKDFAYGQNGKLYFADECPPYVPTFADYDAAMEEHLDAEKAERGYTKREPSDYANSTNQRFAQDAADWTAHRDAVMEYGLDVENKAQRGEPVPTLDEFKANLPRITWTIS